MSAIGVKILTGNDFLLLTVLAAATIGTLFMVLSAIGILRLPDVYTRMHAAGKAATLGISALLLGTGLYFHEEGQLVRMVALITLFWVTAPIATTTMARAAYKTSQSRLYLRQDDMRK